MGILEESRNLPKLAKMFMSLVFILCQIAYIFSVPKIILTWQVTASAIGKDQNKSQEHVCAFPLLLLDSVSCNFTNNLLSPRQTNLFINAKRWLDQKAWFLLCSCNVVSHHHPHNPALILFKEVCAQMVLCHGNRHQIHSLQLPLLSPCLCFWHITWISLLLF